MKVEFLPWTESPWDSLFSEFDTSQRVELVGENKATGRRLLRLKVIRQPEELAKIRQFIEHAPDTPEDVPLSLEVAPVLELEYEEKGYRGKYHMIFEKKGPRTSPIPKPPPFPAFFQATRVRTPLAVNAERFGKLEIIGQQDALLKALQIIEPRLRRLAVVVSSGVPILHGDIGLGRLAPLPFMGEGMVRLAGLVLHIGNASNGVVLVDEIENGLHHSILTNVWRAIGEVAREFNTQVFATTHSREYIVEAHEAFAKSECYDFRLHRLERIRGTIHAVTYDREALAAAIEAGLEVR